MWRWKVRALAETVRAEDSPEKVNAALVALGSSRNKCAAAPLVSVLLGRPVFRDEAQRALLTLGHNAFDALVTMLTSRPREADVVLPILRLLGKIQHPNTVRALGWYLNQLHPTTVSNDEWKALTTETLQALGDAHSGEAVNYIHAFLNDHMRLRPSVVLSTCGVAAAQALAHIRTTESVSLLVQLYRVVRQLEQQAMIKEPVRPLQRVLLERLNELMPLTASYLRAQFQEGPTTDPDPGLGVTWGPPDSYFIIGELIARLRPDLLPKQTRLALAQDRYDVQAFLDEGREAVPFILDNAGAFLWPKWSAGQPSRAIVTPLATLCRDNLEVLVAALSHSSADTRLLATFALEEIGEPSVLDALRGGLTDRSIAVRKATMRALGTLGGAKIISWVVPLLGDVCSEVRRAAVGVLKAVGDLSITSAIEALIKDEDVDVRCAVIEALAALAGSDACKVIVPLIDDASEKVSRAAADAVLRLGSMSAAEVEHARTLRACKHGIQDETRRAKSLGSAPDLDHGVVQGVVECYDGVRIPFRTRVRLGDECVFTVKCRRPNCRGVDIYIGVPRRRGEEFYHAWAKVLTGVMKGYRDADGGGTYEETIDGRIEVAWVNW